MIRFNDLSLDFAGHPIFNNISLQIKANDKIGLIGNNGAGKTTLLNLLSENISPTSGSITKENYSTGSHPAYFTHPFILRSFANEIAPVPKIMCEHTNYAWNVVREIFEYYNIQVNLIYRMNLI